MDAIYIMADHETFGALLGETSRAWRNRLDQRLRPLGLSQAKWQVLLHLNRAKDDLTQKALSTRLGIEGPSLVRLLDRMEADGWVKRRVAPADRRAKTIHSTAKAADTIREIKRVAAKLRDELLSGISAQELDAASVVLQRIKQRAEQL
jgi:MarR family transcriptional regulator for hemolysin